MYGIGVLLAIGSVSARGAGHQNLQTQYVSPVGSAPRDSAQTPARDNTPQRAGSSVIRGRVVAAETGEPLRRATVRLSGSSPGDSTLVATDREGRYEFHDVPPGRHTLTASKTGYVAMSYGQRRPGEPGRPLEISSERSLGFVDFQLLRGGVIVATVIDNRGEPLAGVTVQAQQYRYTNGERRLARVAGDISPNASGTDDRGQIRLSGLAPGDYYVQ